MTLIALYGTALLLGTYVLVALFRSKKDTEKSPSRTTQFNLIPMTTATPAVVEKRVELPKSLGASAVKVSTMKAPTNVESQPDHSKTDSSVEPEANSDAWYSTKIRRPLPESFRRSTRGTEQYYLRDLDPIFRDT
jgi:hypothetical protein